MRIPVVIQHRHVHLSQDDAQLLFGTNEDQIDRAIDQPHQFISRKKLSIEGPLGRFEDVCFIGPTRERTQVELSASDAVSIGVKAPLRISGDLDRSATVILKTDVAQVKATSSAIIPIRHLHLSPQAAKELDVHHHDVVTVHVDGRDHIHFDHVMVRVHPTFLPAFHLTKDEAASHWLQTGDMVIL